MMDNVTEIKNSISEWLAKRQESIHNSDDDILSTCANIIISDLESKPENPSHNIEPIQQGLNIAKQLEKLGCNNEMLAAAFIYTALNNNSFTTDKIKGRINTNIISLAQRVQRLNAIDTMSTLHDSEYLLSQSDNLRKMLLSIVGDVRAVVIKLAECLYTLHAIKNETEDIKTTYAKLIMQLYAPLANRLGIGQLKWELEDIAFRYLKPNEYFEISKSLKHRRAERENYINVFQSTLNQLLEKANISDFSISGRVKHIYSIYRKTQRKDVGFQEIFDTSAVRILVSSIDDCYTILGIIHATWPHIAEEFDDYIAKPKGNGYQSIHTAVNIPDQGCVEIQIRTQKMHDEAELGVAAHWKYKEGATQTYSFDEKIHLLREMLDWQQNVGSDELSESYNQIFNDRIYVFSPREEILDLPQGATALDFAYRIHTEVGHRCKGAKINGKLANLTQTLHTGDHVEIMTGKKNQPSRDWINLNLGYLTTNQAISKVRNFFRKENYDLNLERGQEIWEKACRRNQIKKDVLEKSFARFNFKNRDDLIAAIGAGDIGAATIIHHINSETKLSKELSPESFRPTEQNRPSNQHSQFEISGVDNLLSNIALCCKPIPGDSILGYITKERGITIHKDTCPNLLHSQQKSPERVIPVNWHSHARQFVVNLEIEAQDRKGLLNEVSKLISQHTQGILGFNSFADSINNVAHLNVTFNLNSTDQLDEINKKLLGIPGIISVIRK